MTNFRRFSFVLLVLVLLFAALPALAQTAPPGPIPDDVTAGNTTVMLVPDPAPPGAFDDLLTDALAEAEDHGDALPVVDPQVATEMLIKTIAAIVLGVFGNAPITSVVVSVLKRIPIFASRTAPELTFGVATILWCIAAIVGAAGYGVQFNSLLEALTTIIPALLGLMASFPGAAATHELMAKASVPVLGYKRTPGVVAASSGAVSQSFTARYP